MISDKNTRLSTWVALDQVSGIAGTPHRTVEELSEPRRAAVAPRRVCSALCGGIVVSWCNQEGPETASLGVTTLQDGVELSYSYEGDPQRYHIDLDVDPMPVWWTAAMVRMPQH